MDAVTQRRLPIITADAAFKPGMDSFQQVSTYQTVRLSRAIFGCPRLPTNEIVRPYLVRCRLEAVVEGRRL
jgi:hypothetical protein